MLFLGELVVICFFGVGLGCFFMGVFFVLLFVIVFLLSVSVDLLWGVVLFSCLGCIWVGWWCL